MILKPHDRRQFLQATAALTATTVLPGFSVAADSDPYAGFKVGIQSYSLRGYEAEKAMEHSKAFGLKYWESFPAHVPPSTLPDQVKKSKSLLEKYGIQLFAFGVVPFDTDETKARALFDFAKAMNLSSLSANPKKDKGTFDLLDKLVEEYKVAIAIHNHGPKADYDKIQDVVMFTKDRHPLVGACVDTGHYLRSDENPVEAIETLGKRVFGVHLKDVKSVRDAKEKERLLKELPKGRAEELLREGKIFTILGEGDLDVVGCLRALKKLDYQHLIALEYEENPSNPLADIDVCYKNLREAVKKM